MEVLKLYILIFLHQTATNVTFKPRRNCCISLYSYIKPQRFEQIIICVFAVYPYIPTSNRNLPICQLKRRIAVYPYIPTSNRNRHPKRPWRPVAVYPYIPTSNRNGGAGGVFSVGLYILIFLHQTATLRTS